MRKGAIVAGLLLCMVVIGSGITVGIRWKNEKAIEERQLHNQQIRQNMTLEQVLQSEKGALTTVPVDFESVKKENSDIYAWITVPGTGIDAPVLQNAEDDGYYLLHDADGKENDAGAIYSEKANAKNFSDMLTVLYGRDTVAGGAFVPLLNYEDGTYLQDHNLITVYTPEKVCYYQIFAAYRYDNRHLLKSFDCSNETVYNAYIKSIAEQRNLYANIDSAACPAWPQKILTLSTGHPSGEDYRYLVQAAEIREQIY